MTTVNLDIVLRKLLTDSVTLRQFTEVSKSSTFDTVTRTASDYSISVTFNPITLEQSEWNPVGNLKVGDARCIMFDTYTVNDETITPSEGDYIIHNSIEYEIIKMERYTEWSYSLKQAYCRRRI